MQLQINCVLSISRSFVAHKYEPKDKSRSWKIWNIAMQNRKIAWKNVACGPKTAYEWYVWSVLEGRRFANWVFQFQNEFELIMQILTIQCIKFGFGAFGLCLIFLVFIKCDLFRVYLYLYRFDILSDGNFESRCVNTHCQSKQSKWPSITALIHWTWIYHHR